MPRYTPPFDNLLSLVNVFSRLGEANLYTMLCSVIFLTILFSVRYWKKHVYKAVRVFVVAVGTRSGVDSN